MNRIKMCRMEAGLSQKFVAEQLGVKGPSVSAWESGKTSPTSENVAALANLLGVSIDYLMGQAETKVKTNHRQREANKVPVLGSIPAGIPIEAIEDVIDYEEVPSSWLRGGKEYFGLKVRGVSMLPEYRDGDIIICRQQETAESGQDCAISVGNYNATFKRFRRIQGGVMLQALNSDCESYMYTDAQVISLPVKIIGVVVELRRKFNR